MGKKRVLCGYGIDIDAVAGWLGSYGGEDSTSDISRGLFAGTIGVRRLLKLLEKNNMKATWYDFLLFPGFKHELTMTGSYRVTPSKRSPKNAP